ncbi:MAG: signal peptide peptidase SppA [Proteobacteria bacterium]|nr:signal peptide peptidase SppA [Pseudomonadota bacterium]
MDIVKRFFSILWESLKAIQIFVFGIISLLLLIALIGIAGLVDSKEVPDGGALMLNPVGALVEQKLTLDIQDLLLTGDLPKQVLVKDILDALALAKKDARIEYLILDLDNMNSSYIPILQRIAKAIDDFKSSGKKVIAIGTQYTQSALFLAAHADEVLMDPEGAALIEGYGMYRTYYKTLLENFDVSINLFKVGEYKSAMEPYIRDNMSDEDKEARMEMLNNWWTAYTDDFESARQLPAGTINKQIQNISAELKAAGGSLAQLSLNNKLVDRLITNHELRTYLKSLTGEDSETGEFRAIGFNDYLTLERKPGKITGKKIAVITAVGSIVDGRAKSGSIGSTSINELIRKAGKDEDVVAIVLRVDTGGGSKTASELIRQELVSVQSSGIPLVVSMGSLAASGGYWIAATADQIWASPTTLTGSIGIFGFIPTIEKTLARYGVYSDGVGTTELAGGASIERGLTPLVGEILQSTVEAGYRQFLEIVATGRNMTIEEVDEIAQGRIWSGEKALELGLVDKLGDLEEAIAGAAELAEVEDYSVWYVEAEATTQELLMQALMSEIAATQSTKAADPLTMVYRKLERDLNFLSHLNDPHGAYVICASCPMEP